MSVRVRYGPSPTGEPHVGNIRTALFDWLFARHHGGQFIVRFEDTDQQRSVEGSEALILKALQWLGLQWDEGPDIGGPHAPYRQSERLPFYREALERLLSNDAAYRCTCTPERLAEVRKAQQARKQPPGYDGHCRSKSADEITQDIAQRDGRFVVRFRIPHTGTTTVQDALHGAVSFENALLDDHVIVKSDGYPTYHLAAVVDDIAMQITHVIRGDEWLSSAPRHVLLYEALGAAPPVFVHMPIILGPDKGKLSKRHGATSVLEYARQGFLPEAMINFLALLGWSKDDHTVIMDRDEIVAAFDLDRLGTTSAVFDHERLTAMNAEYIRALPPDEFLRRAAPFLEAGLPAQLRRPLDLERLAPLATALQERVKLLPEIVDYVDFFYLPGAAPHTNKALMGRGFRDNPAGAMRALESVMATLRNLQSWEAVTLESALRSLAESLELKPGVLFTPVRVAVTGKTVAPPLFETLEVLGHDSTLARLTTAADRLARPDD